MSKSLKGESPIKTICKSHLIHFSQDYARALESMKEAEMWMKYSTLSETKSVSFKKDIAKQVEFLTDKVWMEPL